MHPPRTDIATETTLSIEFRRALLRRLPRLPPFDCCFMLVFVSMFVFGVVSGVSGICCSGARRAHRETRRSTSKPQKLFNFDTETAGNDFRLVHLPSLRCCELVWSKEEEEEEPASREEEEEPASREELPKALASLASSSRPCGCDCGFVCVFV